MGVESIYHSEGKSFPTGVHVQLGATRVNHIVAFQAALAY